MNARRAVLGAAAGAFLVAVGVRARRRAVAERAAHRLLDAACVRSEAVWQARWRLAAEQGRVLGDAAGVVDAELERAVSGVERDEEGE
ncbi:hypothetical protein [Streptomyces sp. NPDC060243]|uniref:hypothetical protein n=1 Tax=Streptomyces sp. NPDC060243 TaxID=3347081 RepID=UPI00365D60EF